MSFNEEELRKIKRATSGKSNQPAKNAIGQAISKYRPRIENAKKLPEKERQTALKQLVKEATASRQRAVQSGANSYSHPDWAAAAVCESWLHELVQGNDESIARVENLIDKLEQRKVNSRDSKILSAVNRKNDILLIVLKILGAIALIYNAWIIFRVVDDWFGLIAAISSILLIPITVIIMPIIMLFVSSSAAGPLALWPAIVFWGILEWLANKFNGSLLLKY